MSEDDPLHHAALYWDVYMNEAFIQFYDEFTDCLVEVLNSYGSKGMTPLLYIRLRKKENTNTEEENEQDEEQVRLDLHELLIRHGADPNVCGRNHHDSPLYWAARAGKVPLVRLLLRHGADPFLATEPEGWTPFMAAAWKNHSEVCRVLLESASSSGGDPRRRDWMLNGKDRNGRSPMFLALQYGNHETLKFLMSCGCVPLPSCLPLPQFRCRKHLSHGKKKCIWLIKEEVGKIYPLVRLKACFDGGAGVEHCKSLLIKNIFVGRKEGGKPLPEIVYAPDITIVKVESEAAQQKRKALALTAPSSSAVAKKMTGSFLKEVVSLPNELFIELLCHYDEALYTPHY